MFHVKHFLQRLAGSKVHGSGQREETLHTSSIRKRANVFSLTLALFIHISSSEL